MALLKPPFSKSLVSSILNHRTPPDKKRGNKKKKIMKNAKTKRIKNLF